MPGADLKALLKSEPDFGVPLAQYHEVLLRGSSPFKELRETADRLHAWGYASTVDIIKGR